MSTRTRRLEMKLGLTVDTTCSKCGKVCATPRREIAKTFRMYKRRTPWSFACACGTKTPIDTSTVLPGEFA